MLQIINGLELNLWCSTFLHSNHNNNAPHIVLNMRVCVWCVCVSHVCAICVCDAGAPWVIALDLTLDTTNISHSTESVVRRLIVRHLRLQKTRRVKLKWHIFERCFALSRYWCCLCCGNVLCVCVVWLIWCHVRWWPCALAFNNQCYACVHSTNIAASAQRLCCVLFLLSLLVRSDQSQSNATHKHTCFVCGFYMLTAGNWRIRHRRRRHCLPCSDPERR